MPCLARSPDLNPVENVGYVDEANKKEVQKAAPPQSKRSSRGCKEWEKLPWKSIYNMIDGIPRRVVVAINAEGVLMYGSR